MWSHPIRSRITPTHTRTALSGCFAGIMFACALILPHDSRAQYRFDSWTTDSGLPQNTVFAILQTQDGYLWFTTSDGLVRYDGVTFTIFDKGNTRGIASNRFTALYEDADRTLWIGTEDGFVSSYRLGTFTSYYAAPGWRANAVTCIQRDQEGTLWVSTSGGLLKFQNGVFAAYVPEGAHADSVKAFPGPSGALWYFLEGEVRRLHKGTTISYRILDGFEPSEITGAYEGREGSLWLGLAKGRLIRLKDGTAMTYRLSSDARSSAVRTIYEDRSGLIWVGTEGAGLGRFSPGTHASIVQNLGTHASSVQSLGTHASSVQSLGTHASSVQNDGFTWLTKTDGLPEDVVLAVYEDREGSVWLGTATQGISRITRKAISVLSSRDGLAGESANVILQDRAGDIWIASGGLNRLHDGQVTSYSDKNGLQFYSVTALFEDSEGRLWIGAAGGLTWFRDGKFVNVSDRLGLKVGDYNVWAIHQERGGALWFGTDKGLARIEGEAVRLYTTKDGLAGDDVKVILEDKGGDLWFGTYGGLSHLKEGRFFSITEQDGLSSSRVRSLYLDGSGTLWIGTYDAGLNRLKDGRLVRYTTSDGLFNNGVFQILEDDSGNFWMSSNLGIYRVSRQELEDFADGKIRAISCVSFGRQDGLLTAECNGGQQPAGIKTKDGRLWFPTQQGAAVIDPRSVPINNQPPPIVIESCLLDRNSVDFTSSINIAPGSESLEIRYTGLSFNKPERMRFRYKLEGLDHDWVEAGSRRSAFYSHMPPGRYVFRVIAANSDGVWNTEGESLEIVVVPPFWRTWWFISLVIVGIAAIAAALYRRRIALLERANAEQQAFSRQLIESQESERKRIAAELHDSLGQRLVVIKNLALLGLRQAPESDPIRAQVDDISTETSQAINEVKEIAYNLRPYQLDRIGLTKAIEALVKKARLSTEIAFAADIDDLDGVLTKESEINLYRIIQESLNNIVKHSQATEARILIEAMSHDLSVTIHDNGKGFALGAPDHSAGGGFGLIGIAERVRMLGGTHTIHSAPGVGTTLTIRIDLQETA